MATRDPVNGDESPGSFKWTELGGAENIIHEVISDILVLLLSGVLQVRLRSEISEETFDHWFFLAQWHSGTLYLHWK